MAIQNRAFGAHLSPKWNGVGVQVWWWDPQRSCAGVGDGRNGLLPRLICAFLDSSRGLKRVPAKRRCLVPPMLRDGNHSGKTPSGRLADANR